MTTRTKLCIIFLIAFFMRLAVNYAFQGLNTPPKASASIDQIVYEKIAQSLAAGDGYAMGNGVITYIAPGTPFLISIVYKLFGINYLLVRIMFCLMGAGTCLVIYAIGNRLAGQNIGLSAAAALAIYPMNISFSQHFLSEVPWGLFMALAMLSALKLQNTGKMVFSILFGALLGITAYIRPVSMLYFPIFGVLLLNYYRPLTSKILFKYLLVPVLLFILVLAPWTIRNYIVTNHFVAITTNGGFTFWDGNNERSFTDSRAMGGGDNDVINAPEFKDVWKTKDPYQRERLAYSIAISAIKRHVNELPKLEMMKLYRLVTPFYGTGNTAFDIVGGSSWAILFPFSVIGMVCVARDKRYIPIHSLVLLTIMMTLIWFGSYRYREAIGPFLVLYGAVGFHFLLDKFNGKKAKAGII